MIWYKYQDYTRVYLENTPGFNPQLTVKFHIHIPRSIKTLPPDTQSPQGKHLCQDILETNHPRGCCFLVQAMLPGGFPFHQFIITTHVLV